MITVQTLSRLLFKYDPMSTTCLVNPEMESEYDHEADEIVELINLGVPFKQAYFSVMSHYFWVDRALNSSTVFILIETEFNHIRQ
jgi:hypothetical protein